MRITFSIPVTPTRESETPSDGVRFWTSGCAASAEGSILLLAVVAGGRPRLATRPCRLLRVGEKTQPLPAVHLVLSITHFRLKASSDGVREVPRLSPSRRASRL